MPKQDIKIMLFMQEDTIECHLLCDLKLLNEDTKSTCIKNSAALLLIQLNILDCFEYILAHELFILTKALQYEI